MKHPNPPSALDARRDQMFLTFSPAEIERLCRFGEPRTFAAGEAVVRVGEIGPGLALVLEGEIEASQHDQTGHTRQIVIHRRGNFMGELAQLSGRPYLVDEIARTDAKIMAIAPEKLRALLIAEASLGERIMRALILRRVNLIEAGAGPIVIGPEGDGNVLRLTNFLRRNGHPHQRLDPETDSCGRTLVDRFSVAPEELPIVLCPGGQVLRNPSEGQLARCVGLVGPIDEAKLFDVVIVGSGPAGLATAVYAGSEGLSVLMLDCRSFGGQAGASSRIENYLGFPTGISGIALMARAFNQAQKFGVDVAIPDEAIKLECGNDPCRVDLATGEQIQARTVVIASGARYRRLDVDRLEEFEGISVHYWASPLEADLARGEKVALVGGGNSAGQATVFLAEHAAHVTLVARRPLRDTMSRYLVDRIEGLPNVTVAAGTEIAALKGNDGALDAVCLRDRASGEEKWQDLRYLFSFIGAEPNTDWLGASGLKRDNQGFLITGEEGRLPLETSREGVFAVGDVRAASVKRVASAVGDGAQVVAAIHAYLAKVPQGIAEPMVAAMPAAAV
jgi:thioredoxin reductase (NADPH)